MQTPIHAYVAGWGASNSQCDSDDNGPSPHRMCKAPFIWKGKLNKDLTIKITLTCISFHGFIFTFTVIIIYVQVNYATDACLMKLLQLKAKFVKSFLIIT